MSGPQSPAIDTSSRSAETLQDISLGSLPSFSSPANTKLRVPSTSSQATAFSNPPALASSPQSTSFTRRKADETSATPFTRRTTFSKPDEDSYLEEVTGFGNGDVLNTPIREGKADALSTPMPNRASSKRKSGKVGSSLTLRDQEKVGFLFTYISLPTHLAGTTCVIRAHSISGDFIHATILSNTRLTNDSHVPSVAY